jgi:MFS family permease
LSSSPWARCSPPQHERGLAVGSRLCRGRGRAALGDGGRHRHRRLPAAGARPRLGINVAAVYLGLSVGPPLGGFLADGLGWRWIFLVNLPIGVVVLLWGWRMLPRREKVTGGRRAPTSPARRCSPSLSAACWYR